MHIWHLTEKIQGAVNDCRWHHLIRTTHLWVEFTQGFWGNYLASHADRLEVSLSIISFTRHRLLPCLGISEMFSFRPDHGHDQHRLMSIASCIGETNQRRDQPLLFHHRAHETSTLRSDSWRLCWCSASSHYLIFIHEAKPICFETSPYFWQLLHSKYCHFSPLWVPYHYFSLVSG